MNSIIVRSTRDISLNVILVTCRWWKPELAKYAKYFASDLFHYFRSLHCLDGWPVPLLEENPKEFKFYYLR